MSTNLDEQFIFSSKAKRWSLITMVVGAIGITYGFLSGSSERTFANLLLMGYYMVTICMFAACFCAIQYIAQASWSVAILRIPQVFMQILPIVAIILLLIIGAGIFVTHPGLNEAGKPTLLPYLYKVWAAQGVTTPGHVNYDAIIAGKSTYLNKPFFFIRLVAYLAFYSITGRLLIKYSFNEDSVGGMFNYKRSFTLSCIFLVVYGFTVPLFVFDTIMSLEAHWFSTLFGWYNLSGFLASGFAMMALMVIYLKDAGYLSWVNRSHIHSLGIQIFGFAIFWTYLWFEQFLLMYYSNLPEEVTYYYKRWLPEFKFWFWINMSINFCLPFFALMSRGSKRKLQLLKVTCIVLIIGHWLDYWLMIMPGTVGPQAHWYTEIGVIEIASFAGFAGLFIYLLLNALSKFKSLVPKNHPFLNESLNHHI